MTARYAAVIFDLGNTLVSYYTRKQWPAVLDECITRVRELLEARGTFRIGVGELPERVNAERGEREDFRVVPLEERLGRIFDLPEVDLDICRRFMEPIFSLARVYDDVHPTLSELRRRGFKTGILSNTPWGSPAELWRKELARHRLLDAVDAVVFCRDLGRRKPDRRPFISISHRLCVAPCEALFVGDDPRWDVVGPERVGMDSLLIDRSRTADSSDAAVLRNLVDLPSRV